MSDAAAVAREPRLAEDFLRSFSARWHAAWNSHDHTQVAALCAEDVEWHDPSLPEPGHGVAVIAGLMETLVRTCPGFRFEETEPAYPSPTRAKAIAPWRFTGTMTGPLIPPRFAPTDRRVEFHGDDHWDFRGGLVARCEAVYDLNGVGVQLGAVPAPGSTGERVAVMLQRLQAKRLRRSASP
jgi:ketosteroid isomerase-like protein